MKKTFIPFLCGAFALSLAPSAFAFPTPIAGIAKDGSNNNQPLANVTVQLIRPADKGAQTTLATTRTDAAGRFAFPAREYADSDLLMANISRGGFDYPAVAFDGGAKLKQVGITVNPQKIELLVFDTSTQPVPIDFQVHHLAISSTKTGINCIERIVVDNPSKTTFLGVGPRKISVLLDIPKAAKNVKLDPKITGAQLLETPNGWGIVKPITPVAYGVRNALIVSYDVDWPSRLPWAKNIDLGRKTVYPTKFFFVARTTQDKDLQVTAPKLSPDTDAPVPIDGQTQTRIINSLGAPMMPQGGAPPALGAGQDLSIEVSKPVSSTFWGFAAMTVALCLFLPVAMIKPKRKIGQSAQAGVAAGATGSNFAEPLNRALVSEQTSVPGAIFVASNAAGTDLALTSTSRDLIQKIADLDDLREAGKVADDEYQARRTAWKTQLIESLGTATH
ncbi:hypothetical protein B1R32_101287 [Abditibacterium utsteinense]|uniref:Carboxypeptidase regulatory-like domain-containing protein n=1 Tax=Abditibacterium utsteinense TaxID=1960156 RepID=A0A2S8SXL4_9BACT|nr:hypothetical protein [Abditibacterium utsteinense]PQV65545.1 hypothetical protein B1R32_101287 [Abditibacterium utsteinense]